MLCLLKKQGAGVIIVPSLNCTLNPVIIDPHVEFADLSRLLIPTSGRTRSQKFSCILTIIVCRIAADRPSD